MRILIDMDGICVNLLDEWLRQYNAESGDNLTRDKVTAWSVHQFCKPKPGYPTYGIYDVLRRPGFFDHLPAIPGAIDAITDLVRDGHDVRFATAPPSPDSARGKIEWVMRNFKHLKFGMEHVLMLHDKHWLEADVLIDDKPETIRTWSSKDKGILGGPAIMAIAHPYNRDCEDIADVYAESIYEPEKAWEVIYNAIKEMAGQ